MADNKTGTGLSRTFRNLRGKWLLLLLAAAGVLLLFFGGSTGGSGKQTAAAPSAEEESARTDAYRAALEEELSALCAQVAGVGQVHVTVTLERGARAVYAQDRTATGSEEYVLRNGEGLLLCHETPAVRGVAVVCTGGADPAVEERLSDLLSALLGIGRNRIAVCPAA